MLFVENIIPELHRFLDAGDRIALATLIHVEGSSPRPVGSQIGVTGDGRSIGMISGGCAEKAIIAEAVRCIENAENKLVRYGKGSPYIDVVLPCGSGIDIFIEAKKSVDIVKTVYESLARRMPIQMTVELASLHSTISAAAGESQSDAELFQKTFEPAYRILAFGEGANLATFCTLAKNAGFDVIAFSPDEDALRYFAQKDIAGMSIFQGMNLSTLEIDEYSAVVTLFHEHEWESEILCAALNSNADYIGALGSRRTHDIRLASLAEKAPTARPSRTIKGPVGLDIGAQSPSEISISIIAEIIAHRRQP